MLIGPIYKIGSGYITSSDTTLRSYILYIGPISILYTIYCMMVTSPAQYTQSGQTGLYFKI